MRNRLKASVLAHLFVCASALGMGNADPWVNTLWVDQFEVRAQDGDDLLRWDLAFSAGHDLSRWWLTSEGETSESETEEHELKAYYSRAIAPYWNLLTGARSDLEPVRNRNWLLLGLSGTAPWFVKTEAFLFLGNHGRSGLRLTAERELRLSTRWELLPELEINLHGHNDGQTDTGSGLSKIKAGVRLKYLIRPDISPYVGISRTSTYGNSADFEREAGNRTGVTQFVVGFSAFF